MRASLVVASFGLAVNFILWTVPIVVGAATLPHDFFPESAPALADTLRHAEHTSGAPPSLPAALVQLTGAEPAALPAAGRALQQPLPADIGPQADRAGNHVKDAVG